MTPAQFQARIKKGSIPAATLLLGPEAYERRRIKEALLGDGAGGRRKPARSGGSLPSGNSG